MSSDLIRYESVDLTSGERSIGIFTTIREARLYLKGLEHCQLWQCERSENGIRWERVKLLEEKK